MTLTPHPLLVPWSRKSRSRTLLPLWAVRPVQSRSPCTRVHFTFLLFNSGITDYIFICCFPAIYRSVMWLSVPEVSLHISVIGLYVPHYLLIYVRGFPIFCSPTLHLPISKFLLVTMLNNSVEQSPFRKLTCPQPVKKFPIFHVILKFITVFTKTHPISLSLSESVQFTPPADVLINFDIILPSTLRSSQWSLSFRLRHRSPVYTSLSPIHTTCPAHLILLDFITRTIYGEDCRSLSSSLCIFSSPLSPRIPLTTKDSPQHPILKQPQPTFLPQCERRCIRPNKTAGI